MQNSADFPSNSEQKKCVDLGLFFLLVRKQNVTQTFGLSVKGFTLGF